MSGKPEATGFERLIGLDIGGTKVSGVVLADDGRRVSESWVPHHGVGAGGAVAGLEAVVASLADADDNGVVGVSVGGLVGEDGSVTRRGTFGFDRADIGGMLARRIDRRVWVFNDADATLRAAIWSEPDITDAVMLALGTGVGGSVMWRGRPLRGRTGFAGELGHLPVLDRLGYPCVCGGSGCLEQYASGRGLVERAQELACSDITTWAGRPFDRIEAIHVVDAARAGVASAVGLIDDAARAVGQAVVALAVTTEPDRVYLGGTLAHRAADLLLPRIRSELETRWPLRDVVPIVPVVLDDVGPYAAAVGAALLAGDRSDT